MNIAASLPREAAAELTFTLTNAGDEALQVLNWHTPFEGTKSSMFTITRDGAEVDYRGPMLKRSAPRKDDYFRLQPGERQTITINLAEGWDVAPPGRYVVQYSAELLDVIDAPVAAPRGAEDMNPVALACNEVIFARAR